MSPAVSRLLAAAITEPIERAEVIGWLESTSSDERVTTVDQIPLSIRNMLNIGQGDGHASSGSVIVGLLDEGQVVRKMLYMAEHGVYFRDRGEWVPLDPDEEEDDGDLSEFDAVDTTERAVRLYDSACETGGRIFLSDL